MNVLYLGPKRQALLDFIKAGGDAVMHCEQPLTSASPVLQEAEFIVSYGYRHIIRKEVIEKFYPNIINLHISYLPWNRGADPNLWSFLEDTPKGVTIHLIDEGIDTGDILVQSEVAMSPDDTLATSYEKLSRTIEKLFVAHWPKIREGRIAAYPQPPGGSLHRIKDREKVAHLLTEGWDTPVRLLTGKAIMEGCCT